MNNDAVRPFSEGASIGSKLIDAAHGPIEMTVEPLSQHGVGVYWSYVYSGQPAPAAGIEIAFHGHKEDLAAAGCMKFVKGRYDDFLKDGFGGLWYIESKAGPGKRGIVRVHYFACDPAFAASLPHVRELFPEMLSRLRPRPHLRLVVDNT
jgi:hypothetical protein